MFGPPMKYLLGSLNPEAQGTRRGTLKSTFTGFTVIFSHVCARLMEHSRGNPMFEFSSDAVTIGRKGGDDGILGIG
jgi:hypothetical protein